jgi:hypothetical protein
MVVHGVWTCDHEGCDAGRTCRDPETLAERHAEDTGHETSAERTVFSVFGGDVNDSTEPLDLPVANTNPVETGERP